MSLLAALVCAGVARADDVAPTVENRLWTTPPTAAGFPTAGQFGGFAPVTSSAPATDAVARPASGALRLQFSYVGASVAGAVPEFALGDIIGTPLATFTDTQNRLVRLRREPLRKTSAPFKYRVPNSAVVADFNPATTILGERFFWSQDARFMTVPDLSGVYERVAVAGETGISYDGFVYASQGGSSRIYWRTEAPIDAVPGTQEPIYGLVDRVAVVSTAARLPVRRIFWTEQGFQGPPVSVPKGEIQQVRVAYSDTFPDLVPDGSQFVPPGAANSPTPITRRTLWYENDALRAYNLEGRVILEFLGEVRTSAGLRRQVGIEVVDVIQEAFPGLVDVPIGERLYPLPIEQIAEQNYPLPTAAAGRTAALANIDANLALYNPSLVVNPLVVAQPFTLQFEVAGQVAYYATRTTSSASDVQIFWREPGLAQIQWPKFLNRYRQAWPDVLTDYAVNVRPSDQTLVTTTVPIFGDNAAFELIYQDDLASAQARLGEGVAFEVGLDSSDPTNRSLLLFRSGNDFWFVRVESVLDKKLTDPRYADYYATGISAPVGTRLAPPAQAATRAGYVDLTKGDAIDPTAYINPFASGIPAAEAGAIIPVNAAPAKGAKANDKLGVWWFSKVNPPARLAGKIAPLYWPSYYRSYDLTWPANARQIVLASNAGSGDLDPDAAAGSIYFENDPSKIGYNPNEEHAQMIAGRAYALRDDLNNPQTTSDDYVLVRYTSAADLRPAMLTFRVLRENERYTFTYNAKAGTVLQGPLPLAIMPPPLLADGKSRNTEVTPANIDPPGVIPAGGLGGLDYYRAFTFEDRKGLKWVYRGQHDPNGSAPSLGMKFYYPTQEGFAYPNPVTGLNEAPAVGTITPFLRPADGQGGFVGNALSGDSITVGYRPYWPDLGPAAGLKAEYFAGTDLSGRPVATRVEQVVDFTLGSTAGPIPEVGGTNYSIRYTGTIVIPTTGAYTFSVNSDDGGRLWVSALDGAPAVDIWSDHSPFEAQSRSFTFSAGARVPVRLEYYQRGGGAVLQFRWSGPGIAKALVPASVMVPADGNADEVASLQFAETLVKPKNGLPGLSGASSVEILYQQSIAKNVTNSQKSAVLHDATRRKITLLALNGLPNIPSSIATTVASGRTYFQRLPAHLQQRVYVDPNLGTGNPRRGGLVLEGQFKDEVVGDDYLLPNILSAEDRAALKGLVTSNDALRAKWETAIDQLTTKVETFVEDPAVPGTYIADPGSDKDFTQAELVEITNDDQAVDSYALTGVGGGSGYVTLLLGNGSAFTDESEPVQMAILRVGPADLYRGQVKPVTTANPLAEDLTLQHTGDFAGRTEDFEFQWYYTPPVDGQPPANLPDQPGTSWFAKPSDLPRITIDGTQPLLTLTDNYYVMRYRPKVGHVLRPDANTWDDTQGWSQWTAPALAEGWIKRVLAGINPFNQRLGDFFNNAVNTDVSLITQAGTRWEGNLPLTLGSVQDAGLIEIYETVLRRGIDLSIGGTPSVDYGPANDALLLAAGYLNDLYMALGNEAYADAANPLISLDVDPSRLLLAQGLPASIGTTIQNTATSRFAFEGQVPSLLDEDLTLLRGRDDFLVPGDRLAPVYNRFFWNYTRGINAGEVIYALNYNISEKSGPGADGKIDATDAARQYPQGHGDAYGHYLTALTNYYRLLSNPQFTWTPRVEAVNILGVPVTVDYQDERKLATAAVALGRTASRVIDLERRKLPVGTDSGWSDLRESKANASTSITRAWGVEQWAVRGGQGNFIHWAVVNSLLPESDLAHEGIQKIDRQNVPELNELAALGAEIQSHLDGANRHANALNLSDDSVLFDLSPSQLAAGSSHFDQILARAKAALANVATAHARTIEQNALLRTVENQSADYSFTVDQQETAFNNRLIDIYGQAYSGDIGPGKFYPQGYSGPDYLRFMYIDRPYIYDRTVLFGNTVGGTNKRSDLFLPISRKDYIDKIYGFDGTTASAAELESLYVPNYSPPISNGTVTPPATGYAIRYTIDFADGPYQVADVSLGSRNSTGAVQQALAAVLNAREQIYYKARSLNSARIDFGVAVKAFREDVEAENQIYKNDVAFKATELAIQKAQGGYEIIDAILNNTKKTNTEVAYAAIESFPKIVGFANDVTSAARGALAAQAVLTNTVLSTKEIATRVTNYLLELGLSIGELNKEAANHKLEFGINTRARITDLQDKYGEVFSGVKGIDAANKEFYATLQNYQNILVNGQTIQEERETFRKRAAAVVQGVRTRDVAFRAFRTESLEQYKLLYDQAARYTFLAAKAYDYETAQLGTTAGRDFLSKIVSTRSLGLVGANGEPQIVGSNSGDAGLSSLLAKLQADWSVAKGRLGINNPDAYGTLLSLRRELFNLPYKEDGSVEDDIAWQDKLRSCLVADLRSDPTVAAHALPTSNPSGLAQPGFIISFPTTIETGQNFFAKALGAGDSAFSSASYSTKINSVGVAFKGYLGMNPYATGSSGVPGTPTQNAPDALAATPYVYLIPAGADSMRTPPLNGAPITVRNWLVLDHAMPLPFDIGSSGFGQNTSWTGSTSLSEPFFLPRKHQPFRAVADPTLFYSTIPAEFTNRRLIGRSVWNTEWKLVIPAQTLLADPQDGIERFIRSVKDIKLFMRTYSNAGN